MGRCVFKSFYALGADLVQPPRKRSRAEIMNEVVAKSKAYKVCLIMSTYDFTQFSDSMKGKRPEMRTMTSDSS